MRPRMKRKVFIQKSALVAMGSMLAPSILLSSCSEHDLPDKISFKGKVLIIGAGAAGLYAGHLLRSKNIEFEIIEASSRIGGRLEKLTGFSDVDLDLGGQWLHGNKSSLAKELKSKGVETNIDNTDLSYWFNKKIVTNTPQDVEAMFEAESLPDVSYRDYATSQGLGIDYSNIVEAVAADSGADAGKLSAYWKVKEEEEWSSGEDDYAFKHSFYDAFMSTIDKEVIDQITLNSVVKSVNYSQSNIEVKNTKGDSFNCARVIVTVPISILQSDDIQFIPNLSENKMNAIKKIGIGYGMKVFLKFDKVFYRKNLLGGKICAAYIDAMEGKSGSDNVLMAFIMGEQAQSLTSLGNDTSIFNALITELDEMYDDQASGSFISGHVKDWSTDPHIRGAYSFSTVGIGNARSVATESIDNRIFFAGEAMNTNGHHQTVHGAMETAFEQVSKILVT